MCGIAGIVLRDGAADLGRERAAMEVALVRLAHRGPDDSGLHAGAGVLLGNRRLAILDLSPGGHQPMTSTSGDLVVVLNGEIYNYIELRRVLESEGHVFRSSSDTEVLLAAWKTWGEAALERLHGMFAFAVWNARTRRLVVARDRLGEKPLFFWRDATRFVFASELKALLALVPTRPALSPTALDTYLHYQYVIEPETPLEGVRKLRSGHVLAVGPEEWNESPRAYWDLSRVPPIDGDPVARLRDALERAAELTLRSDADVGIALSGGLDSAVIAALARRKRSNISGFTVGYPGHPAFDERQAARQLAERLDIPFVSAELPTGEFAAFFPELVAAMDEPIADVAAYGHFAVAKLAASHGAKVLLTGIGGDELFFGYGWVREALRLSRLKARAVADGSGFDRVRAQALRRVLAHPAILHAVANRRLPQWWRDAVDRRFDLGRLDLDHADEWVFYQLDYHWEPAQRFTADVFSDATRAAIPDRHASTLMRGLGEHLDPQFAIWQRLVDSWLVSNCLALGDRVSMAASVEARIPLLERTVVETVIGLWKSGRTDDSQGHKLWLRAAIADLLPADVLNRPKQGFVTPTREWIAAINDRYRALLVDGSLVDRGILDGGRLRRWLAQGPASLHREFFQYKLTQLELWNRLVPEGQRTADVSHALQSV